MRFWRSADPSSPEPRWGLSRCVHRSRCCASWPSQSSRLQPKWAVQLSVRRRRLPHQGGQGVLPERVPRQRVRDLRCRCRLLRGVRHHLCPRQVQCARQRQAARRRRPVEFRTARPPWLRERFAPRLPTRPAISSDPAHFEFLDGNLAKDSTVVYWSDGTVLSDDPVHFAIVSNTDHYLLFTKDSRTVRVNGKPIPGSRPADLPRAAGCLRAR